MSTLKLGALASLAADTTTSARMVVIDADKQVPLKAADDTECYIDFLSVDSEVGRKLQKDRNVAVVRKLRSGRNRPDDEDFIEEQITTLAALATGWHFGPDADAFSNDNAKALFSDPEYAWLRRQAWGFVNAEANFIKRSSKT